MVESTVPGLIRAIFGENASRSWRAMFMQRMTIEEAIKSIQAALDKYGVARVTDLPREEQERLVGALRKILKSQSA